MNGTISDFRAAELQHILSTDANDMARYEKDLARFAAGLKSNSDEYEKLISSSEERKLWELFKAEWAQYLVEHNKILALSRENKNEEARELIRGESQKRFDKANETLDKIAALNAAGGEAASRNGDEVYASARLWVIGMILAALAIGMALAMFISRIVSKPLIAAVNVAKTVASGDLTSKIDVRTKDETGQLLQALKDMNENLVRIVGEVRSGTDTIATASSQIASGNIDLSSRTEQQASSLEETASSMEELTSTVRQNADNAKQANQLAATAGDIATRGGEVVSQVVDTMGAIHNASVKIVDIIAVIDGIAFQTNILALNAAVEAARAGEQGRGFAVVAAEVRTLAQRSANAAKEIKVLIDDSVEKVNVGSQLVEQAGATISELVDSVKRVNDIISEISAASQEQSVGIDQVNQAISQMDQVTQQNAALVEEAAAAATALQDQASGLARMVDVFRLDGTRQAAVAPAMAMVSPGSRPAKAVPVKKPMGTAVPAKLPPSSARMHIVRKDTSNDWEEF
jgi:methyl-accepting chemotaxis protein